MFLCKKNSFGGAVTPSPLPLWPPLDTVHEKCPPSPNSKYAIIPHSSPARYEWVICRVCVCIPRIIYLRCRENCGLCDCCVTVLCVYWCDRFARENGWRYGKAGHRGGGAQVLPKHLVRCVKFLRSVGSESETE